MKKAKGILGTAVWMLPVFMAQPAWALKTYVTGNAGDVIKPTQQAVCLAGGGSDDAWADGWRYLLERSGGGDIVIIRADGSRGGYEPWIYEDPDNHNFPKVDSVTTLSFGRVGEANLASVETAILNAELVFFAGGDQSKYIDYFKGTKLAAALDYVVRVKKIPVGGTSAGMAILGDVDYGAHYSSPAKKGAMVTSADVMKDPTGSFIDLDRSFFVAPFLSGVVTDTHFSQRAREGRLVGFMARAVYNNYADVNLGNIKAIASDEATAVCYDETGQAHVFGANKAFFLKANGPIERIQPGTSLDWFYGGQAVNAYVIQGSANGSAVFDLNSWSGAGGSSEYWYVNGSNALAPFFGKF